MGQTKNKTASFANTSVAGAQYTQDDAKARNELAKASKIASWVLGILFALIPVIICWFSEWFHASNPQMAANYEKFVSEFISNGSFLWISITLLVMSFVDLLLYGFRVNVSAKRQFAYKLFVLFAAFLCGAGIYLYLTNISSPVDADKMKAISWFLFILYAVSSAIVSFRIVREV